MNQSSDLTFITNEGAQNLLERFKVLIKDTVFFDVLVGYFRSSGFFKIYESLESVSKIRILVGLNMDSKTYELIGSANAPKMRYDSSRQTKIKLKEQTIHEMENSEDSLRTEQGVHTFINLIAQGKLEFRAYPHANIHSKVYISRFGQEDRDFGRVITGSSNFSASGFTDNLEFNVELKNRSDVVYALEKFEKLWEKSIDVSQDYIDTVKKKTWMNPSITPYEIFLKVLHEWFGDDIDIDDQTDDLYFPDGFRQLKYQQQAVTSALKILDAYNGVFLSDVVGLGKTYISALLAKELGGRKLVVCPPVLQAYWEETFRDFGVRGAEVVSHGKLDHVVRKASQYEYVFVDEAHRFRNENTQRYEKLHMICWGKKVILVSATPLNNKIDDVYSQLKLFQVPRKSTIPGIPNIDEYFSGLRKRLSEFAEMTQEFNQALMSCYKDVRDRLLRHIMVRRTRNEILQFFSEDLDQQPFPELGDPQRMIYKFDSDIDDVLTLTTHLMKKIKYSRYTPMLYLKDDLSAFVKQSQINIGGFMKAILVKRLESSFYAFKKTVNRFVHSHKTFIKMYENGSVYIGKDVNILDYLDNDNESELLNLIDEQGTPRVKKYDSKDFRKEFYSHLREDLKLLKRIESLWNKVEVDPKLAQFISHLTNNKLLATSHLLVFTESKETGEYLYKHLERIMGAEVMFYCSGGGIYQQEKLSVNLSRDLIRDNFDQNSTTSKDDIRILITTDVLSEGTNLHRSNTVINYDLPWNPIKVMQRVGRINRLGAKHAHLFVYNFFPTTKTNEHLGLKENIKSKIKAFHEILGEDAKYLTNEEAPSGWRLFGDNLYDQLEDKRNYEGVDEGLGSDLRYLRLLQEVRDNETDLFRKIEGLPRKARSGLNYNGKSNRLITFFRKGALKKFLITDGNDTRDLSFLDAIQYFECNRDTPATILQPEIYYPLLQVNKEGVDSQTMSEFHGTRSRSVWSNENYIIRRLRVELTNFSKNLTQDDRNLLGQAITALEYGVVPEFTIKKLKKLIERESDPVKMISIIQDAQLDNLLKNNLLNHSGNQAKIEIVLSQYLNSVESR